MAHRTPRLTEQPENHGGTPIRPKEALSWAARTYLVAALSAIASVLYYVFLILGRRD